MRDGLPDAARGSVGRVAGVTAGMRHVGSRCDPRDPCLRMSSPQAVHAADSRVGVRVTEITREFTLNGFGIFVCILKSKNFVACQTFREVVPTARGGWNHASRWLAG